MRQVSAFRVSLLEMYKKHLECINHIPAFRQKEQPAPAVEEENPPVRPAEKQEPEREIQEEPEFEEQPEVVSESSTQDLSLIHISSTIIAVCGCMTEQERVAQRLKQSFPFVNLVFGTHVIHRLPEMLRDVLVNSERVFLQGHEEEEILEGIPVRRDGKTRAWVTAMYGCDNFCSYCIVPVSYTHLGFHKRGRRDRGRRHGKYQNHSHRAQKAEGTDSLFGSTRRSIYVRRKL